jgi:hypothetical protein
MITTAKVDELSADEPEDDDGRLSLLEKMDGGSCPLGAMKRGTGGLGSAAPADAANATSNDDVTAAVDDEDDDDEEEDEEDEEEN